VIPAIPKPQLKKLPTALALIILPAEHFNVRVILEKPVVVEADFSA